MLTLITVIHLILALLLVVFVLLQDPKGGGAFGMGGGSSQSIFGASGANNFLVNTTKYLAILFTGTCIGLSYMTIQKENSVTDTIDLPEASVAAPPAEAPSAAPSEAQEPAAAEPAKDEQ